MKHYERFTVEPCL